jgi:uncharacterized protein
VIFSPRNAMQVRYLEQVPSWSRSPIVLHEPAHFVSLLKSVDVVVSAGGTMLREAAFLGIPAYSIFRGRLGAVDRHLVSIGRLSVLSSEGDFAAMSIRPRKGLSPLREGRDALEDVVEMVLAQTDQI